jgi:hypothetical protein
MVLGMRFLKIRGVDIKVVVIVPHVTCRNEQMAEAESGKFPYFWLCPVQFDQYPVSVFESAKLFFACGGTCFELAEIFHKCDALVHRLRKSLTICFLKAWSFARSTIEVTFRALNIRSPAVLRNLTVIRPVILRYLIQFMGYCFLPYLSGLQLLNSNS